MDQRYIYRLSETQGIVKESKVVHFHYSSLTPGSVHEADNCNTYQPCSVSATDTT